MDHVKRLKESVDEKVFDIVNDFSRLDDAEFDVETDSWFVSESDPDNDTDGVNEEDCEAEDDLESPFMEAEAVLEEDAETDSEVVTVGDDVCEDESVPTVRERDNVRDPESSIVRVEDGDSVTE
jgi:hypothetical protein